MSENAYLTTRVVLRAIKRGSKAVADKTMDVMGYNIVVQDGWVIKKFPNGDFERIEPVQSAPKEGELSLD